MAEYIARVLAPVQSVIEKGLDTYRGFRPWQKITSWVVLGALLPGVVGVGYWFGSRPGQKEAQAEQKSIEQHLSAEQVAALQGRPKTFYTLTLTDLEQAFDQDKPVCSPAGHRVYVDDQGIAKLDHDGDGDPYNKDSYLPTEDGRLQTQATFQKFGTKFVNIKHNVPEDTSLPFNWGASHECDPQDNVVLKTYTPPQIVQDIEAAMQQKGLPHVVAYDKQGIAMVKRNSDGSGEVEDRLDAITAKALPNSKNLEAGQSIDLAYLELLRPVPSEAEALLAAQRVLHTQNEEAVDEILADKATLENQLQGDRPTIDVPPEAVAEAGEGKAGEAAQTKPAVEVAERTPLPPGVEAAPEGKAAGALPAPSVPEPVREPPIIAYQGSAPESTDEEKSRAPEQPSPTPNGIESKVSTAQPESVTKQEPAVAYQGPTPQSAEEHGGAPTSSEVSPAPSQPTTVAPTPVPQPEAPAAPAPTPSDSLLEEAVSEGAVVNPYAARQLETSVAQIAYLGDDLARFVSAAIADDGIIDVQEQEGATQRMLDLQARQFAWLDQMFDQYAPEKAKLQASYTPSTPMLDGHGGDGPVLNVKFADDRGTVLENHVVTKNPEKDGQSVAVSALPDRLYVDVDDHGYEKMKSKVVVYDEHGKKLQAGKDRDQIDMKIKDKKKPKAEEMIVVSWQDPVWHFDKKWGDKKENDGLDKALDDLHGHWGKISQIAQNDDTVTAVRFYIGTPSGVSDASAPSVQRASNNLGSVVARENLPVDIHVAVDKGWWDPVGPKEYISLASLDQLDAGLLDQVGAELARHGVDMSHAQHQDLVPVVQLNVQDGDWLMVDLDKKLPGDTARYEARLHAKFDVHNTGALFANRFNPDTGLAHREIKAADPVSFKHTHGIKAKMPNHGETSDLSDMNGRKVRLSTTKPFQYGDATRVSTDTGEYVLDIVRVTPQGEEVVYQGAVHVHNKKVTKAEKIFKWSLIIAGVLYEVFFNEAGKIIRIVPTQSPTVPGMPKPGSGAQGMIAGVNGSGLETLVEAA